MDFDTRINRIENVIQQLSSAESLNSVCPAPVSSSDWNNSKAREAAEDLFTTLDTFLADYSDKHAALLAKLQSLKLAIVFEKMASYNIHRVALLALPEEKHAQYMNHTEMDPSVKRMLTGGGYV
ncbi:hypothetical protein F3157_17045 [Virgibacillus dakarensis]|uniref:hypothetical protein n=1 Tax=Virgibacillus dakarensis TaxID=1917889 RepID=UPI000B430AEB|nr:hypothetical protein [Virgibacillus dakarensis]MBT2214619.1 hypothetical protein [Virgibacillus dakarensis]MTW87346.1 hypothetical protein [Virgibacillus dakarensis]